MIILKLILKAFLLPVLLLIILGQWIGTFFTGIASAILGFLSGLCWILAILGYLMGVCTGHEAVQILIIAFVTFLTIIQRKAVPGIVVTAGMHQPPHFAILPVVHDGDNGNLRHLVDLQK